jgi:predicted ABC-type ATPase
MNIERPLEPELEKKVMVEVPTDDKLQNWFTYHKPTEADIPKYLAVREAALTFARVIDANCPFGADKTAAIRKIREAVMTANAAIACCGK